MENTDLPPKTGGARGAAPTSVDIAVGRRLRLRRRALHLSAPELADRIGISNAQLHKYETATNRIGASRLYAFADALGVAPSYFFEDLPPPTDLPPPKGDDDAILIHPRTWEMLTAFDGIRSPAHKQAAYALLITLATCLDSTRAE